MVPNTYGSVNVIFLNLKEVSVIFFFKKKMKLYVI